MESDSDHDTESSIDDNVAVIILTSDSNNDGSVADTRDAVTDTFTITEPSLCHNRIRKVHMSKHVAAPWL